MVGKIIKLNMNEAVNILKLFPTPKILPVIVPKAWIANKPKITDGISASNSIAILSGFWYFCGIRYLINTEDLIPKGPAIIMAINVVNNVIVIGNQILAWFSLKSNFPEKRILTKP